MKQYYQIDRYANPKDATAGRTDAEYSMIKSTSAKQALIDYLQSLGYVIDDADAPVIISEMDIRGTKTIVATCPIDTTSVWSAIKAK
jgi:hypothetical protein